jgi:hypothetical protein
VAEPTHGGWFGHPTTEKKEKRNKNSRVLRATPKGYKGGSATPKGYRGGSATLNGQNDSIFSFSFFFCHRVAEPFMGMAQPPSSSFFFLFFFLKKISF